MIVKMCVTPTGEARNASIPLIFLLHCLCVSCPPAAAQSALPKGPLGQAVPPCSWALQCCLSHWDCLLGPPVLALPLILPFHGQFPWHVALHVLIRHLACGSSKFSSVFFSVFVFLQLSWWEQTFLHCQEQHNLQHFLPACWAEFANHGLVLLPPDVRVYLFLQGMSMDFAVGGPFLP